MSYAFLADATAITHITIIVAVLLGLLISFRYKRFRPWEAAAFLSVIVFWSYYGNCPLTIVEQHLRDLAGQNSSLTSVGFLPYYANKLWGMDIPSRIIQRSVFFTGGAFFAASIQWLSPVMHMEIFKARRTLRRLARSW
ncbi:MAG: DUF2784 family protein [Patescibacteria group bacterium]